MLPQRVQWDAVRSGPVPARYRTEAITLFAFAKKPARFARGPSILRVAMLHDVFGTRK